MTFDKDFWKRKVLFRLDELVALVLILGICLVSLPLAVVLWPWRWSRNTPPPRVLLFSFEGVKVAPARVRCYHFAEVLQKHGVDASVFAYWDEYSRLAHFPFPFRRIWETEKVLLDVVTLFRLLPRGPMTIMEQRPNYDFLVPLLLRFINGSRVVMDIDDWILSYKVFHPIEVRHMLSFFSWYSPTCIVSSHRLRTRLSRHFPHLPLLPTYVDHHRFTPGPHKDADGSPVVFSWVGTIFQDFTYDNVMFMIESFALACDTMGRRDEARLEIVGGGDFFNRVKEQIGQRFADYPVVLNPWMAPDDMPAYLQGIDVGLYCLVEPSLFHESKSPTKIFEYYACAKPVVSTRFGEASHFVEHGQTGFLADDREGYAQGIITMIRDRDRRESMGREARARVDSGWNMIDACLTLKGILLSPAVSETADTRGMACPAAVAAASSETFNTVKRRS